MALEAVSAGAVACLVGNAVGAEYGEHLHDDSATDYFRIKRYLTPVMDEAVRRGYLKVLHGGGVGFVHLALPCGHKPDNQFDFDGTGHRLYEQCSDVQPKDRRVIPIIHHVQESCNTFHIAQEHVPAFLVANNVCPIGGGALVQFLTASLRFSMSLVDCKVEAEYSILQNGMEMTLKQARLLKPKELQAGDVLVLLRLDLDFREYVQNPFVFEDDLKSKMLKAIGLDAESLPSAKRFLTIKAVEKGSIQVWVIFGGCLLLAAAFNAALYTGRHFDCQAPGGAGFVPRNPGEERRVARIRYRNHPDGGFDIEGEYDRHAPPRSKGGCVAM